MMANRSLEMRANVSRGCSMRPSRRATVSRMESPAETPTESLIFLNRSMSMQITVGR